MAESTRNSQKSSSQTGFGGHKLTDQDVSGTLGEHKLRIRAKAVSRIFNKTTGKHVGWLYEWNTGELTPRWKYEEHIDVYYE